MDFIQCPRERTQEMERLTLSPRGCLAENSRGRERQEGDDPVRTVFQRDIDRIVHCKTFRRLSHKTQVFLSPEGDHYRTRMTHTLEVSRIARAIAVGLQLNENLTEAIALGHDLGHTPYGHAGERALAKFMSQGFRHNQQSLRVVERLEREGEGLNLTYEVRDGILNHTGANLPTTLEGQVVRLADRIAYLNHDIEDALRAGVLFPTDIPIEIYETLGYTHSSRIGTLVQDMIVSSVNQDKICQSEKIGEAMDALRTFMFQSVYTNPMAKGEEGKAQEMLSQIFRWYQENPDELPGDYQHIRLEEGTDRAICDYISGMTDSYATEIYTKLFIPKNWTIK